MYILLSCFCPVCVLSSLFVLIQINLKKNTKISLMSISILFMIINEITENRKNKYKKSICFLTDTYNRTKRMFLHRKK